MAGGDGALFRSSKGRWKRLFHFSGDVGKLKSVAEAAGEKPGAEDGEPPAEPKPLRSILVVPGQAGANRSPKRTLAWLHGLVDQEIEPHFDADDDRRNSEFMRSAKRKSTGFGMEPETHDEKGTEKPEEKSEQPAPESKRETPQEPPKDEGAALRQDHKKNSEGDDDSEAFSESDEEFEPLEALAQKNMRINKAATKISPAEIEANTMKLPLGPLPPLGNAAKTGAKSAGSSFGDSSDDEQAKAPKVVEPEPKEASAFTVLPAGSACAAAKQLRKQDSKSSLGGSSFGSSDDDK